MHIGTPNHSKESNKLSFHLSGVDSWASHSSNVWICSVISSYTKRRIRTDQQTFLDTKLRQQNFNRYHPSCCQLQFVAQNSERHFVTSTNAAVKLGNAKFEPCKDEIGILKPESRHCFHSGTFSLVTLNPSMKRVPVTRVKRKCVFFHC